MTALSFRNLDVSPDDPVESWPYEGIVTAIERGSLPDWRRLARAIERAPWGRVARAVLEYAEYGEEVAVVALLTRAVADARERARRADEQEAAQRVRRAVADSGLSARAFARECGTSPARLSTYCSGVVQPSAALLVRFERVAAQHRRPGQRG